MIALLTYIQEYVVEHYQQWLLFVVIFIAGFVVIYIINRYVAHFFDNVDYDRTVEIFIEKSVKIFLWIVFVIVILSNLGFNVTGFVAGLGAMGIIIGFATKDVLSNLAAGMFLLVTKPMKIGESVEIVKITGIVKDMGISSSIIITDDKRFVTIPNSKIWGNPIINYSRLKKKK